MRRLKEFLEFIRINICFSIAALAATGYLLVNRLDYKLIYVTLSAFFGCAAAYTYNNITDIQEDIINRKKTNYFAGKPAGKIIAALCALAGFYFALNLSGVSTSIFLAYTTLGIAYSFLRIKKYVLIKNIWTAFSLSLSVLFGAFAISAGTWMAGAYITVFLLMLAGSIIADIRDTEGDFKEGIATIPTRFGVANTKNAVYSLFAATAATILLAETKQLRILLPFLPAIAFLVAKGRLAEAHATGKVSLIALLTWLLASGGV